MAQVTERRGAERRSEGERRRGERRQALHLVSADRRSGADRRQGGERRQDEGVGGQIRNALELLARLAQPGILDDERRRDLDAAIFRLRFALERLEAGGAGGAGGAE